MSNFVKQKPYLVCVDSDGCAMDTMNYKHIECFGPLAKEHFNIKDGEKFLALWNTINLYSKTRGVNRFKGLLLALQETAKTEQLDDFSAIEHWINAAPSLSNASLEQAIVEANDDNSKKQLQQTLDWSLDVNKKIVSLEGADKPFDNVLEALKKIHDVAHIAIVSSANREAIDSEWNRHGLMEYVDIVYGQEAGTKSACIKDMLAHDFDIDHVLMVGDSPGDVVAAQDNDVLFYPILFGLEGQCWEQLYDIIENNFMQGNYRTTKMESFIQQFNDHLSK